MEGATPCRNQQATRWHHPHSRACNALDGVAEVRPPDATCASCTLAHWNWALLVNLACALLLLRVRHHGGSLGLAAFRSARNDVLANAAIIVAGLITGYTLSMWPDLIVGSGIAILNAGAAGDVYKAAARETDLSTDHP
jgi:divalent metal cation (Fe/Co/Zn/Cd) transporter